MPLANVTTSTSSDELLAQTLVALGLTEESSQLLKLLYKGKRLQGSKPAFSTVPKKTPKILVMATPAVAVKELNSKRSDPLIRGFDNERRVQPSQPKFWGPSTGQHKDYKFCRFQACTWQSFGHRATESTPHGFAAQQLLEKLATDPGVKAVLIERELVVGTLGEMDPIDDRLMQKTEQHGGCLLGYNTNHGLRIDLKLRTDDLSGFRPYPEIASTLIHELSHNWVGEHNLLFWTNFGQMRAEYLHTHARLRSSIVDGKTTAEIAGLDKKGLLENVYHFVMQELARDMAQHGLHPNMIAAPIQQRCNELEQQSNVGKRLGGSNDEETDSADKNGKTSARELALAAAERRARQQQAQKEKDNHQPQR